jgi:glucoamylase
MRSLPALLAAGLVAVSLSGATAQPPEPIPTGIPAPYFGAAESGPFSKDGLRKRELSLGPGAPAWARAMYRRSIWVLAALTNPETGAMIAGERQGWDYVWPRDASAGAIALEAAGLHHEARRVTRFLAELDLDAAARFYPDGDPVPGRGPAGDADGWVAAAERATASSVVLPKADSGRKSQDSSDDWRDSQDYGENVTGDLLGNAVAAGAPAAEIDGRFLTERGLMRERGGDELDSSAAWAVTLFPQPALRSAVRKTLLEFVHRSTPFGIPPIEHWTPGEVWTAPTAWSAWALVELGEIHAADRLLRELHRAETPVGTLPERVDAADGRPTSTTPLAWSHAFAILALRARYGAG